jgi:hypothetical protein
VILASPHSVMTSLSSLLNRDHIPTAKRLDVDAVLFFSLPPSP